MRGNQTAESSDMTKAPEKLLGVAELVALTGLHKNTIKEMMRKEWAVRGGAKLIRGEFRVTVSFYNRWLDGRDCVTADKEDSHAA